MYSPLFEASPPWMAICPESVRLSSGLPADISWEHSIVVRKRHVALMIDVLRRHRHSRVVRAIVVGMAGLQCRTARIVCDVHRPMSDKAGPNATKSGGDSHK